jgi:hypothetical protein
VELCPGCPEDALVSLDFSALDGGFLLPGEADPVWAGDLDRMFISLVPPGYTGADAMLPSPAEGWAELTRWPVMERAPCSHLATQWCRNIGCGSRQAMTTYTI